MIITNPRIRIRRLLTQEKPGATDSIHPATA
jgi:hypothetical protein